MVIFISNKKRGGQGEYVGRPTRAGGLEAEVAALEARLEAHARELRRRLEAGEIGPLEALARLKHHAGVIGHKKHLAFIRHRRGRDAVEWTVIDNRRVGTGTFRAMVREVVRRSGASAREVIGAARELRDGYDDERMLRQSPVLESYYAPLCRWFVVADSDPEHPDLIGLAYGKVYGEDRYEWELYYHLA